MKETNIDIRGIEKAEVLLALYTHSRQQGMGFLAGHKDLTISEAREIIKTKNDNLYFDYLYGRVMKIDLTGDEFDPWLYDRDNGEGSAERVVNSLRE